MIPTGSQFRFAKIIIDFSQNLWTQRVFYLSRRSQPVKFLKSKLDQANGVLTKRIRASSFVWPHAALCSVSPK